MTGHPAPNDDDLLAIAQQVWSSYLDPEGAQPLVPGTSAAPSREASASVSVTGAWRGHIVVSCSAAAARSVAAGLLGVDLADVTPEDVTDALGELANVIGGNVKGLMPEPSALSLPVVLINGAWGWPSAIELCRLDATWLGEPVAVRVLESSVEKES